VAVTVTGYTAPSGNYTVSQPTGLTANITKAALTITGLTANNKPYDGLTTATLSGTAAYSGLQNGETFSVTGTPSASFAAADFGTGVAVTVTGYTAPSGNYTVSQPTGLTANITKAALTITAANQTVTFGTPVATVTGAGTYVASGFVNLENSSVISGTVTYTTTYTATTPALTSGVTITPVVTGLTATNYSFTPANGVITISKAASTITATGATSFTYTGIAQGPSTSTVTGSGGAVTYSYSGVTPTVYGSSATKPTNAGTYQVIASVAADANYNAASSTALAFTIGKVVLTITAGSQTVIQGTPVATVTGDGTYTASGFVNSENSSVISGTATYTTTYTATTPALTSGITITPVVTGLTATNYSFTPVNGTITIEEGVAVQLTEFVAVSERLNAQLSWKTATEIQNAGFEIERRFVSKLNSNQANLVAAWVKVGYVEGAGTSNSPKEYSFTERGLEPGRYAYRLKMIDKDGTFAYSASSEVEVGVAPKDFVLNQNYPNPFNPTTTIEFTLQEDGHALLRVYNMVGQEVATLVNDDLKAGMYQQIVFNAKGLASGIYFARLEFAPSNGAATGSGAKALMKRLVLLK
jgi:hypothetical protein